MSLDNHWKVHNTQLQQIEGLHISNGLHVLGCLSRILFRAFLRLPADGRGECVRNGGEGAHILGNPQAVSVHGRVFKVELLVELEAELPAYCAMFQVQPVTILPRWLPSDSHGRRQ